MSAWTDSLDIPSGHFENPGMGESAVTVHILPLDSHFFEVDSGYNRGVAVDMGILHYVGKGPIFLRRALCRRTCSVNI